MKKILAILLALGLGLCPMAGGTAAEPSDTGEAPLSWAAKTALALGIMNMDGSGAFGGEQVMTRIGAAKVLADMMRYSSGGTPTPSRQVFHDVNSWDAYAGEVEYLYQAGVISGTGGGNFSPYDEMILSDLFHMLLNGAGYRDYPLDFRALVVSTGIAKGISAAWDAPVTKAMLAQAVYNLMDLEVWQAEELHDGETTYQAGEPFLQAVMQLYRDKGVVTADEIYSIKGEDGVGKEKIQIDMETYPLDGVVPGDVLGYSVDYYLRDYDTLTPVVCALLPREENQVVTLSDKDLVSVADKVYTYHSDGKAKKARLAAAVNVVYNGCAVDDGNHYMPAYGQVRLIDHDNDGLYDTVFVDDCSIAVLESVDEAAGKLYCRPRGDEAGVAVDLEQLRQYHIFNALGYEIGMEELQTGMVLSLQYGAEGSSYIRITAADTKVKGIVETIETSGEESVFLIEEQPYEAGPQAYNLDGVSVGDNVILYLDSYGRVAYAEQNKESTDWLYGYVINCKTQMGIRSTMQLKLLSQNGEVETFLCAENVRLNGKKAELEDLTAELMQAGKPAQQVIRYMVRNGQLQSIDTAAKRSVYDLENDIDESGEDRLLLRAAGVFSYKANPRLLKKVTAGDPEGEIALSDEPLIFSVPQSETADDEEYYLLGSLRDDQQYTAEGYNTAVTDVRCSVIVEHRKETEGYILSDPLVMVDKISKVINKKEEESYKIIGLSNGNTVEYVLKNPDSLQINTQYALQQGDIIRVKQDFMTGEVRNLQLIYSKAGNGLVSESSPMSSSAFNEEFRILYGRILHKSSTGHMVFQCAGATSAPEVFNTAPAGIYVYDKSLRNGNVYMGKPQNISPQDMVVVHTQRAVVRSIYVIK